MSTLDTRAEDVCAHLVKPGDREVSACGNYAWPVTAVEINDDGWVSITANGTACQRPRHALVRVVRA
jgi:hypothetical protein